MPSRHLSKLPVIKDDILSDEGSNDNSSPMHSSNRCNDNIRTSQLLLDATNNDTSSLSEDERFDIVDIEEAKNTNKFLTMEKYGNFGSNFINKDSDWKAQCKVTCLENTNLVTLNKKSFDRIKERIYKKQMLTEL